MKLKRIALFVTAAALCLALASCRNETTGGNSGQTSNDSGEKTKNTSITLTESWEFDSGFYPVVSTANSSNYGITYWTHNFYDTLVKYDPAGKIIGSIAESWDISEDGKTYTFKLREGVKFSDGTALTAEAVKKSIEAAIVNLGMYNGSYGKLTVLIESMETPDEKTFVLKLTNPYYGTLNDLTMSCPLAIVNPTAFEGGVEKVYENLSASTAGTGPYMYAGSYDGTTYTFTSNPHYWGEKPEVETFKVKVIPENDAKLLALRNGEIDGVLGASRLNYDSFASISGANGFETSISEAPTLTRYLGLNLNKAPFNDAAVREALSYAIDQQALEASVFNGIESAAESLFPKERPYCNVEAPTIGTDVEKAKGILESAGWTDADGDGVREKDGIKLEANLSYTQSLAALDDAVLAIKGQMEAIGFKVSVSASDMMTWYAEIMSGEYTAALWYTYGGAFDPTNIVTNMNPAVAADPIAVQFSAFFDDPSIIEEVDSTADLDRVQEIYKVIITTIAEENLIVPITYTHETFAYKSDLVAGYTYGYDSQYVDVASIDLK